MNSDYTDRLKRALSSMASNRDSEIARSQENTRSRQQLLDRFVVARRDVIRHSMGSLSDVLHNQNIKCQIVNDDSHTDQIGRKLYRAGVTLRVYKDANIYDSLSHIPHFSVLWDEVNSVARFHRNNATRNAAGEATYVGKAEIHELTSDMIERRLVDFTSWIFERNPSPSSLSPFRTA